MQKTPTRTNSAQLPSPQKMNTHSCTGMLRSGGYGNTSSIFLRSPQPWGVSRWAQRWDCSWREQSSSTGVLQQELGGKTFLPAWELLDFKIFSWLSSGWEGQTLAFFSKENPKHILRETEEIFFDWARVFHLFCILCVLHNKQAKTNQG